MPDPRINDYDAFFLGKLAHSGPVDPAAIMREEVQSRRETENWSAPQACPSCGAKAHRFEYGEVIHYLCSRRRCRHVMANSEAEALALWNEPRALNATQPLVPIGAAK